MSLSLFSFLFLLLRHQLCSFNVRSCVDLVIEHLGYDSTFSWWQYDERVVVFSTAVYCFITIKHIGELFKLLLLRQ